MAHGFNEDAFGNGYFLALLAFEAREGFGAPVQTRAHFDTRVANGWAPGSCHFNFVDARPQIRKAAGTLRVRVSAAVKCGRCRYEPGPECRRLLRLLCPKDLRRR
ncbi:MAG: hypothetical protein EXQ58_13150 [Acidobacteria bacterium]|nr:hypothetical protein [Acidobacteriota bacterium]